MTDQEEKMYAMGVADGRKQMQREIIELLGIDVFVGESIESHEQHSHNIEN